jgi:DNA-directed RNA polymerase subunit RPC12/RpoP
MSNKETQDNKSFGCPDCDRSFDSKRGRNIHHTHAHNESENGVVVECNYCGEEVTKPLSEANAGENNYCGMDCFHNWQSENMSGEDSHLYKGGNIHVECEYCGDGFERKPAHVKEKNFCSTDCMGKWQSENQKGENNPRWRGGLKRKECEQCGGGFKTAPADGERFCSRACYAKWLSENRRGEDHPNWVEDRGRIYYGASWESKREERLEIDDYECAICGMDNEEQKKESGVGLDVHHITKIEEYLDDRGRVNEEMAHRMENLITLCRECHRMWEGIPLKPEVKQ